MESSNDLKTITAIVAQVLPDETRLMNQTQMEAILAAALENESPNDVVAALPLPPTQSRLNWVDLIQVIAAVTQIVQFFLELYKGGKLKGGLTVSHVTERPQSAYMQGTEERLVKAFNEKLGTTS
jgi:hypothetical protein